jgi:hypothetical protein
MDLYSYLPMSRSWMKEGWAAANAVIQLIMMSYLLKGRGHEMIIFLRPLKIDQYFLYMRKWFFLFIGCPPFQKEKEKLSFSMFPWKHFLFLKLFRKPH